VGAGRAPRTAIDEVGAGLGIGMTDSRDIAGVIAPPPLIYAGALLVGGVLGRLVPSFAWPLDIAVEGARIAGLALLALGILLLAAGLLQFRRHGTPVPPHRPTTALVTTGVYRISRNPLYLALTALYLGIGLLLPSLPVLVLVLPVLVAMRYGVIAREERYLEGKFGDAYRDYKTRVRRWL
jgi:protein-S-isoprenylcysteine O-methyltransferase Ste14